jgi:hypothetical protein
MKEKLKTGEVGWVRMRERDNLPMQIKYLTVLAAIAIAEVTASFSF